MDATFYVCLAQGPSTFSPSRNFERAMGGFATVRDSLHPVKKVFIEFPHQKEKIQRVKLRYE